MSRHDVRPIFLVGCPRSGTTLLRLMLDSHPRLSCGPETHFLTGFEQLFVRWNALRRYGFPREYWLEKTAEFFDSFQREYAAQRGRARWADKTPLYALHLPFIAEVFPALQVVHVIRDGRDVMASHRASWGMKSALGAPDKWRRFIEAARHFGAQAPSETYHEMRYEDLVADPEATMRAVLDFLGEEWDDVVLRYDEVEHDVYGSFTEVTAEKRSEGGERSLIYASRVGRGQRLDPVMATLFRARAGQLSHELGYR